MASEEMSVENVDGRRMDDNDNNGRTMAAWLYYKLTHEPSVQES